MKSNARTPAGRTGSLAPPPLRVKVSTPASGQRPRKRAGPMAASAGENRANRPLFTGFRAAWW